MYIVTFNNKCTSYCVGYCVHYYALNFITFVGQYRLAVMLFTTL